MRVAETIRALRKAYGVGICSVEEICAVAAPIQSQRQGRNLPRQPANGNYSGAKVRDRLRQIIRHHQVDPDLVKTSIMMLQCARLSQKLRPASLTSFSLLPGQQAADKLRLFPSIVFDCPFLTARTPAKHASALHPLFLQIRCFNSGFIRKAKKNFLSHGKYKSAFPPTQSREQFDIFMTHYVLLPVKIQFIDLR